LIFSEVFRKKEYILTSFDHLMPLRNEDGHHRPIGPTDELVAITYARQLVERIDAYVASSGWPDLGD
jgi:hypothetical protein